MGELVTFLAKWQTLSGAFLGGVFSLSVALMVAYVARRREDVVAAMLVVGNLTEMTSRQVTLTKQALDAEISKNDYPRWLSDKLIRSRPKLTPTFDAAIALSN